MPEVRPGPEETWVNPTAVEMGFWMGGPAPGRSSQCRGAWGQAAMSGDNSGRHDSGVTSTQGVEARDAVPTSYHAQDSPVTETTPASNVTSVGRGRPALGAGCHCVAVR